MINKIRLIPSIQPKLKRAIIIGTLASASSIGAHALAPVPIFPAHALYTAANAATAKKKKKKNKEKENLDSLTSWQKDSIAISERIKLHQAQINELEQELELKKQMAQQNLNTDIFQTESANCCKNIETSFLTRKEEQKLSSKDCLSLVLGIFGGALFAAATVIGALLACLKKD